MQTFRLSRFLFRAKSRRFPRLAMTNAPKMCIWMSISTTSLPPCSLPSDVLQECWCCKAPKPCGFWKPATRCVEHCHSIYKNRCPRGPRAIERFSFTPGECINEAGQPITHMLAAQFGLPFILAYVASYMLVAMGIFNVILAVSWLMIPSFMV